MSTGERLESPHELLASERNPVTNATLTIRVIKSFEYRTQKSLVLKDLDLTTLTVGELLEKCKEGEWRLLRWCDTSGAHRIPGMFPISRKDNGRFQAVPDNPIW